MYLNKILKNNVLTGLKTAAQGFNNSIKRSRKTVAQSEVTTSQTVKPRKNQSKTATSTTNTMQR